MLQKKTYTTNKAYTSINFENDYLVTDFTRIFFLFVVFFFFFFFWYLAYNNMGPAVQRKSEVIRHAYPFLSDRMF